MRKAAKIGLTILIVLLIISGIGYAFYYNYTNLQFSLSDASVSRIELKPNWKTIYYSSIGNHLLAVLSTVYSIDLDVTVQIHNPGFLPVIIPSFDYMLYGNGIDIGPGSYPSSITVSAGSTETIHITQKIIMPNMQELINSIVNNEGNLNIEIDGKVHLRPLSIDIPFHATRSINVYQAIWDEINYRIKD